MHSSSLAAAAVCACGLLFAAPSVLAQKTLAHWNFDSGSEGTSFSVRPADDLSGNGYLLYGYDNLVGPSYSSETMTGSGFCCRLSKNQDGYTVDPGINNWSPSVWTIEVSFRLNKLEDWRTIVGRDGSSWAGASKADFYFQKNGVNNRIRLDFATVDGGRYMLESSFAASKGQWYHAALVSDGSKVSMYIDSGDGAGYQLAASTALTGTNNALAVSGANWIFGRGWYGGKYVDYVDGSLDDIRFTDGALQPAQFLHAKGGKASAAPAVPKLEAARNGREVSLTWSLPEGAAEHYDLYRNTRETPAGRTRVATLYPPASLYLDQVPEAETTYWYWIQVRDAAGRETTIGPVASKPATVWTP